jgi:DNA-binding transcriptional ArsR family regulator
MRMDIEKILASSNRRKIFRILRKTQRMSIMDLVRKTKSTYNQVHSDLKNLEKEGLVIDERQGHSRIISLNRENPKTDLILKALKLLNGLQKEANNQ